MSRTALRADTSGCRLRWSVDEGEEEEKRRRTARSSGSGGGPSVSQCSAHVARLFFFFFSWFCSLFVICTRCRRCDCCDCSSRSIRCVTATLSTARPIPLRSAPLAAPLPLLQDVGNSQIEENIYDSFTANCIEAQKAPIFYPACQDMFDGVDDMIGVRGGSRSTTTAMTAMTARQQRASPAFRSGEW